MDYLYLRYGMQICLRNKITQKYLSFNEQTGTANATSMPPYIEIAGIQNKTERKLPSLKFRIALKDQKDQGAVVTFGSKILLIDCQTQSYLISVPSKKTIGFDKPGLHQSINQMLQKTASFIVLDQRNARSKQPISVYDQVHFKSVMGFFIFCQPSGQVSLKSDTVRPQTAWNMMKADTPYIPAWVYHRPTFSKFLNLNQVDIQSNYARDPKNQLGFQASNIQEMKLVEDILDVMLSFDGEFIKKSSQGTYALEPHKQKPTCSSALTQLTKKILDLPTYYCIIQNYISTYSIQQGTVCQALCSGLRQLIKQYKMMVIQFDEQVSNRGLTLQQIWYHIQPSLQLMESIVQLIKQVQQKKGGQLITCILKMLNGTTSQQVVKIYTFLFDKCIRVYIQMISKWIYQGLIQDKFQQFMVMEVQKDKDQPWTYWEQKFVLRREQVPSLFQKDGHFILVTGKYLNVIKACSGLQQHPLHKQIEKNIQKHIKNQDFTENIMRAYDWANQRLQNLVLKQYKLEQVLKSMKGYYFLAFGDLFVHFMDSAQDDLNSKNSKFSVDIKLKPVSVQKLQNLFELLIRTSSANSDIYKQDISCKLQSTTIYQQIHKIKTLQFQYLPSQKPFIKKQSRNVDYFNLDFKCQFPLNLIINKKNLSKYQTLFRYLFWCKFIQRQLNSVWLDLQATKVANIACFKKANLLTQKMLNFIKGLIYYLSYEVIQKNWRILQVNLTKIRNFEDIITFHNQFLAKCLNESLLINNKLLTIITNDLGNSCQGFFAIKKYVCMFDPHRIKTTADPKSSILNQKIQKRRQIQKHFKQWVEEKQFEQLIYTLNDGFDKNMKKLLRQIYSIVGKDEANSHLVGLLDTLDPKKYYNKLFQESRGVNYI